MQSRLLPFSQSNPRRWHRFPRHDNNIIRFSISITRVYRHELCIETNRFTCTLLRLRCCVPCHAAAAGIQMRVSSLCPCPGCCAGLIPSPLPWTPRPLPQRIPRRSPLGPASIGIGRHPAGQPRRRPGPVPWPGCTCARRPVLIGSALGSTRAGGQAGGGMQGSAAAPTARPAPGQQPNCGCYWHFAMSVLGCLLFIGRVYKHDAYEKADEDCTNMHTTSTQQKA